jgi:hypothetical protein
MRTLLEEIVHSVMDPALQKKWFGSPKLSFRRYLGCYQEVFELGVVLGHAYRGDITKIVQLFSQPGHETQLSQVIQELAAERFLELREDQAFFGIAMFAEEERIRANWLQSDPTLSEEQLDALEDSLAMPLEKAFQNLQVAASTGIGFGSAYPELTERFWVTEHEGPVDLDELKRLRSAGLDVPAEPQPPITLPNREAELRRSVQLFVVKYRPELCGEFGS